MVVNLTRFNPSMLLFLSSTSNPPFNTWLAHLSVSPQLVRCNHIYIQKAAYRAQCSPPKSKLGEWPDQVSCHSDFVAMWASRNTNSPVMRPHIAYVHNEPCATLARHFCDNLGQFTLKDDKGRQGTTCFATICDVLYHSTILYSAPFHFCDLFQPFLTLLDHLRHF